MSILHENSEYYESKYLKYKAKYLELKQIISGGGTNVSEARREAKRKAKIKAGAKIEIEILIRAINRILINNGIPEINIGDEFFNKLKDTARKLNEIEDLLKQRGNFTENKDLINKLINAVNELNKLNKSSNLDHLIELLR